ncbi:hypothetical protein F511_28820 [Dorcoceras hygrometricum]|uniref:Uncharacterized protein n=1 Tax=Dorcoceras hygrometricum TaxID=472368 RepID=A0A2Z7B8C9_9LAMI|nr:hypothetical protein F511_28820 [Dorcoceras hygrometricum]
MLDGFCALPWMFLCSYVIAVDFSCYNQADPQDGEGSKTSGDKAAIEPKKEKVMVKKKIVAGSSAAPPKSKSETSSDEDKSPMATLPGPRICGAVVKCKLILVPSDPESTVPQPEINKKLRTKRPKLVKTTLAEEEKAASKELPLPCPKKCLHRMSGSFRTEMRLKTITSMTPINSMDKVEDEFMTWAETSGCMNYMSGEDIPQITWVEARIVSNQETTAPAKEAEEQLAQIEGQQVLAIENQAQEHQAQEHQAREEEQQAQDEEKPDQQAEQQDSSFSINSYNSVGNNEERQVLVSSNLHIVQYTEKRAYSKAEQDFAQAVITSLESMVNMMRDDQTYMKYDSQIFRRPFYKKMDEVVTSVNTTQTTLETNLVRQFTERQHHFASEMALVK